MSHKKVKKEESQYPDRNFFISSLRKGKTKNHFSGEMPVPKARSKALAEKLRYKK